ncbi:MAG: superoxide dismutase [Ni] [Kiritimatiellae bacterium]|jgi:nickel superoxide dismutase|nr:superoxide dismutase [Ni] [Kiritimatiellia bacterium]
MKTTHTTRLFIAILFGATALSFSTAHAHCQIPCGIYNDHLKLQSMLQDADTVIKSVELIQELAGKTDAQSSQQLVRWVTNKETHAESVIAAISDYYLTQRVKASQENYEERLVKHHTVIVAAMKAKQQADAETAQALKEAIEGLASYYPEHSH